MKTKKGFTMIEIISVIVLLGIILVIIGTKGFGAFENTKIAISVENEKTIKEAANVLMTEVKNCEGNEDIYSNLINGTFDASVTDCESLKEKANDESSGCLKIDLEYLINYNYITSDGVKEIYNKAQESGKTITVKGCLTDEEEINLENPTATPTITTTTTNTTTTTTITTPRLEIGPKIEYRDDTEYVYLKNPLDLENLSNNITCWDEEHGRECKEVEVTILSKSDDYLKEYYKVKWTNFDGNNLSSPYKNIIPDQLSGYLWNTINKLNNYKIIIIATDKEGDTSTFEKTLEATPYEGYEPIIEYKNKEEYIYNQNNLFGEKIAYLINENAISCKDGYNNKIPCESINYKIMSEKTSGKIETLYERTYTYKTKETHLIKGEDSVPFEPGDYTLFIEGKDKDGLTGSFTTIITVLEYPYDYSIDFFGSYYFEYNTINTDQIYLSCTNEKNGNKCSNWYYEIRYNNKTIKKVKPGTSIVLNNQPEGLYDIYVKATDELGNITEEYIYDAFYVYSPCGEYVEECHIEYYDTSYTDYYCYDYEMCDSYPMTWCDWDNCTDICCWDSWDTYCWPETYCEPYYFYDYEEVNVCDYIWYEKSCVE